MTLQELDFTKTFDILEPAIQEQTVNQGKKRAFTHSSTWVGNVRYNPQNQTMRVMMNNKGYGFCGVPEKVFDSWQGSPSKGEYWWRNIKDRYNCSSLTETTTTGDSVRDILHREEQLRAMGIPESEIFRTVVNEFSMEPDVIEEWPPKITGEDKLPTPDVLQIPNTVYPPFVQADSLLFGGQGFTTELAIPNSLSNVTIGGKKKAYDDIIEGAEPYPDNFAHLELFPEDIPADKSLGAADNANPSIHGLEGWASYRKIPEFSKNYDEPRGPNIITEAIRETVTQLQHEFKWMSPEYIEKAKTIPLQNGGNGRVLLIRAAAETLTDHRAEAPPGTPEALYLRKLGGDELHSMARTGITKGSDINHLGKDFQTNGVVLDADYDVNRKEMQMVHYETDPEILQAITNGTIGAVSINGGLPRRTSVQCEGECYVVPEGVILGENDNIAFTYVITNPQGMMWRGQVIPPAKPGIAVTKIEFLN